MNVISVNENDLPLDVEKYPFYGMCGKCWNFKEKLDKDCLCLDCYSVGVRVIGINSPPPKEIL